jgi:hypothetical protein
MDLTPYVAALRDDLAAAAAVGDEATTRAGNSLAAALEPAVRLALMNALSDLAGEVTEALGDRTVSLRLSGREVNVVVDRDPATEDNPGFFAGPSSSPFAGAPSGGPGGSGGPHRQTPPGPGFGHGESGFGGRGGPDVGDISRMTLRLVDQLKGQAERAAAAQGMSLNSWIGQAVQGALKGQYGGHHRGPWGRWDQGWDHGWDRGWPGDDRPSGSSGSDSGSGSGPDTGSGSDAGSGSSGSSGGSHAPGDGDDRGEDGGTGGVDGWVKG